VIKTIRGLYRAFDDLFQGIGSVCRECREKNSYPDCQGYIWLLGEEAEKLLANNIEVAVANRRVFFINSFADGKGGLDIEQIKPPCPHYKHGKCSIRSMRPLVCRMYPLGFSKERGKMSLVLYLDCLFSQKNRTNTSFLERTLVLFERIDPALLQRLICEYQRVLDLSRFPQGKNKVLVIKSLKKNERR